MSDWPGGSSPNHHADRLLQQPRPALGSAASYSNANFAQFPCTHPYARLEPGLTPETLKPLFPTSPESPSIPFPILSAQAQFEVEVWEGCVCVCVCVCVLEAWGAADSGASLWDKASTPSCPPAPMERQKWI